jgi:ribonuclease Z
MQKSPDALMVVNVPAMLTTVCAGSHSVSGISVGGVYTSLAVPELGLLFDAGAPLRSLAAIDTIVLSHGHVDHIGSLPALLGIRGLQGKARLPRVIMPAEIEADLTAALAALSRLQRSPLEIEPIGMRPGDEIALRGDLRIRAVRTFHPVPSLGYVVVRRVAKLRPEFQGMTGPQIGALRHGGTDVTEYKDRLELAYATDTLISALDHSPELYQADTLIMECTFLDERKSLSAARASCHIHLDEVIERAGQFANRHVVMMHFSKLYSPDEISGILDARLPPELRCRVVPFIPGGAHWPG